MTLIHRRDQLRSEKILQDRLFANPKIEILWDHVMEDIIGDENPASVTGAKLRNVKTDEVSELAVDGIFVAIGHDRDGDPQGHLELDDEGYDHQAR